MMKQKLVDKSAMNFLNVETIFRISDKSASIFHWMKSVNIFWTQTTLSYQNMQVPINGACFHSRYKL